MALFDNVRKMFGVEGGEPHAAETVRPKIPSLEELRQLINKSQVLFRQTLAEAEASAKKSQELYEAQFKVPPAQRRALQEAQARQDDTTRKKMANAMVAGRNTAMLQDVEVVLRIEESFRAAGLATGDSRQAGTLADIQKELEQASLVVESAMDAINKIGSSIQGPAVAAGPSVALSPEAKALWDEFDRETDMAKKMEIKETIDSLNTNKPVQVTLGGM